jgi:hypothetical protein
VSGRASYPHAPGVSLVRPANPCFDTLMVTPGRSLDGVAWQRTTFGSGPTLGFAFAFGE